MVKKDYVALAFAFKLVKPSGVATTFREKLITTSEFNMWRDCVLATIRVCQTDNVKFNAIKFSEACGLTYE